MYRLTERGLGEGPAARGHLKDRVVVSSILDGKRAELGGALRGPGQGEPGPSTEMRRDGDVPREMNDLRDQQRAVLLNTMGHVHR